MTILRWRLLAPVVLALVSMSALALTAAERARPLKSGPFNAGDETVEMFAAIEAGQIEVKLIARDAFDGKVFITNKTDRPLNVRLPDAVAGVHVLAQMGGMGGMGGGMGGGAQAMGGGMGGMGGGMGGMGGGGGAGGGFFNVPAEKVGELPFKSVCLEHGKPDPRPAMVYELRPLDSVTDKPAVHELVKLVATGKLNQRVAQAAAWHLNNDMSWDELAAKQIRRATGQSYPYFSAEEIAVARKLAEHAVEKSQEIGTYEGQVLTVDSPRPTFEQP